MFLQEKGTSCPKHWLPHSENLEGSLFSMVTISRSVLLHQRSRSLAIGQTWVFQVSYHEFLTGKSLLKDRWTCLGTLSGFQCYIYCLINRHLIFFLQMVWEITIKENETTLIFITNGQRFFFFFNLVATTALIKIFISFQSQKYSCCLVTESCSTLCNPMECSMPDFPILHCLLEFSQAYVHWVSGAIQPSHLCHPLSSPALNLSQHQGLFQWVGFVLGGQSSANIIQK